MKIIPHNPMFLLSNLILPWHVKNTYISINESKITFSRYYCFDGQHLNLDVVNFNINDIEQIGFPDDLHMDIQEASITSGYGIYVSQEIIFKTSSEIFSLNARPYNKGQIKSLIQILLKSNPSIICTKRLKSILNI